MLELKEEELVMLPLPVEEGVPEELKEGVNDPLAEDVLEILGLKLREGELDALSLQEAVTELVELTVIDGEAVVVTELDALSLQETVTELVELTVIDGEAVVVTELV
jgi:hypothetical protein